jgi:glycyl-tRNA synthetase beta chain
VEAVLAVRPLRPLDIAQRLAAVESFLQLPQAAALAAANKRIANLLRKAPDSDGGNVDPSLLAETAEQQLAAAVERVEADPATDYARYLQQLAALHDPVNAFFDGVMVMAEDEALRANRLRLLARLQRLFLRVADVGLIGG